MKQALLIILSFSGLFSTRLLAQSPTLTNDNSSPATGDNYISQSVFSGTVPTLSGGINQTWNYSTLTDSGKAAISLAVLPSATPFTDSFPGSNVAVKTADDSLFIYFTSANTALYQEGFATRDSDIQKPAPHRTYLTYPFTFGSSFSGPISEKVPGYDYTFTGTEALSADGYGTLVLTGKTYSNVIRAKYVENTSYSFDSSGAHVTITAQVTGYLYFTPGTHVPLFSDVTTTARAKVTVFGIPVSNDVVYAARNVDYLKSFTLPVTFQSFTALLQNKDVVLQWKTAMETNTDHYSIQRSLTGRDFQPLASVNTSGNNQGSSYIYTDKSFAAGNVPATLYYRIQETDRDGRQTTSNIAVIHGGHALRVTVYPNPAGNYLYMTADNAGMANEILVYDIKGSLLKQWRNHSFSQPINIADLTKGTYLIKITTGDETTVMSLIKQ